MSWEKAWLNYRRINKKYDETQLDTLTLSNDMGKIVENAVAELIVALKEITDINLKVQRKAEPLSANKGIVLKIDSSIKTKEAFQIEAKENKLLILAQEDVGLLYGVFEIIRLLQCQKEIKNLSLYKKPSNPIRILNHWDNMDGTIERGYSGNSFFFQDNGFILNNRIKDYARLIASIGINAVVINNVNVKGAATELITYKYFNELKIIANTFGEYGIKLYLSLNFAAPVELGFLDTADPLDENVRQWWKEKMRELFKEVPNLGGFLVKADSEGRPGPFTYGRTHGDGANMLAEAVKPYDGTIIWRCFVYNCQQDWRDLKIDRARSGYDHFMSSDGMFADNVILQIKNGPMDFQVREPISPLLGGLKKTNQIMEVQIAQEYTGQQKHVCYLIPMFREILNFRTYCQQTNDTVKDIISGKAFNQTKCGIAAVTNTGSDSNWTGHDLAGANLYGFGRLSFDTSLTAEEIAEEWIRLNISNDQEVVSTITTILMESWHTYEKYTSPLGIGWMVNPNHHFGPNVDGYEYDRWGTYHRADWKGIGVNRGSNGTGYVQQYYEENAKKYNDLETCPEELLLFFHYVEYTYKLKTGKTLIQHIYDTHFEGVEKVEEMLISWNRLEDKIDEKIFNRVTERLMFQANHSKEWRDIINSYFCRKSGIADEKGRRIY